MTGDFSAGQPVQFVWINNEILKNQLFACDWPATH
jgi:hypothetical protein